MLPQQRQASILDLVRRLGAVRVTDLVREFEVSDMTIRRDLEALAGRGLVAKVHGGATAVSPGSTEEPGFAAKASLNRVEKAAIASRAAGLVEPGSAIGLSAGTSVWTLAPLLVEVPGLTVVTNSIPVADVFFRAGRSDQTVIIAGGIRTPSDALVGPLSNEGVRSMNLQQVFLGVHGMSVRAGFTTPNVMEAEVNRAFVQAARRLVVLADHTKWQVEGLCTFARLGEADVLISDVGLTDEARGRLAEEVGKLVVTDPGSDPVSVLAAS